MAKSVDFSVTNMFSLGWQLLMRDLGKILKLWLGAILIVVLPQMIVNSLREDAFLLGLLLAIGMFVLQMVVSVGIIQVGLRLARNKGVEVMDLVRVKSSMVFAYLIVMIVVTMLTLAGLLFFVIPGIYIALMLSLAQYLVVDKDLDPFEALSASKRLTDGKKMQLLGFFVLTVLINTAGALVFGLGLLVTIPWTWMAGVALYLTLHGEEITGLPAGTQA